MNERIVEGQMALGQYHFKVRFDGISHPAEVITTPFEVQRETDEEQRERMRPHLQWIRAGVISGAIEIESEVVEDEREQQFSSAQLLGDHLALLSLIGQHPEFSTTQLYKHLGWSASKGGRIRDELLAAELIVAQEKPSGTKGGRKGISYQLTTKAKELLDYAKRKTETRQ